ncbi:MAG TPA: RlmE family RNA methyltransferase [bacterium]|jgi:23S rRNA (uridine2552-2'-O)-methyltransferase
MKKVQDHYFRRAKREGFAARSVYKLEELDRSQRLLRPGQRVLDLGCAPGSWLQYAAQRVGASGRVLGVDLQALSVPLPPQARALEGDVFGDELQARLGEAGPFDVILSDMAPRTSGIRSADAARSAQLVLRALELARALLRPGGTLLVKVFQGAQTAELRQAFAQCFARVRIVKPKASRAESVEVYLLGEDKQDEATSSPVTPSA